MTLNGIDGVTPAFCLSVMGDKIIVTDMRWITFAAIAIVLPQATLASHPIGQPDFAFACPLGAKSIHVTTEGRDLVYRYGPPNRPESTIRGNPRTHNVFARRDMAGAGGAGQQLRFVNGAYSYVLSSLFLAKGKTDETRFFVVHDSKVVTKKLCRDAGSFEDYDQLDLLPRDTMKPLNY